MEIADERLYRSRENSGDVRIDFVDRSLLEAIAKLCINIVQSACASRSERCIASFPPTHELMAIFGWQTVKEAERFTRSAERKRFSGSAKRLLNQLK